MIERGITELLANISEVMKQHEHPPLEQLTVQESRHFYDLARTFYTPLSIDGITVLEETLQSPLGHTLPIRVYRPQGDGPFPVLLYFHGGGWVFGDLDSAENVCQFMAQEANAIVVSATYRQAPEHKYPAAFLDSIAAVSWTFENSARFQGDPTKITIGGESSGGNLAASAALYYQNHGTYRLHSQLLITPVTHYHFETSSYQANYRYNLTSEKMKWFWQHYLEDEKDGQTVFASPLLATSVDHLPATLLVTVEGDPLRDEGIAYGKKLEAAGVAVTHLHYAHLVHSFVAMIGTQAAAKQALQQIVQTWREQFACPHPTLTSSVR
ncbi:esterase/lipase [Fictibacillus macauensis ZFHKF-1]|uniref:Esterase/lipase n=1 Tax=Fictibacillus macauensis ZFHKF-1 TaxID=1196324 RepID=I8UBB0_9BACL|nr:alpha/beta hydrolase [Fictibacillus macauensis]EIT84230.1 esterase/lipase [Fictibacillus macauensis ZFHKF-1]